MSAVVPVTVQAWTIQDGAYEFPGEGDVVDYQVGFREVTTNESPELCIRATVDVEPVGDGPQHSRHSDGTERAPIYRALMHFGSFTARAQFDHWVSGALEVHGMLFADYESVRDQSARIAGTITRRRLIKEIRGRGAIQAPTAYRLSEINAARIDFSSGEVLDRPDGSIELAEASWQTAMPPPDRPWWKDSGVLVDLRLSTSA